ncbi:MAG TPA: hypothetical protein VG326_18705 [Tepidisphaeraceae bacterium]|jgi:hypothetical protein|nr:hypothetical protein [Tepidisphaeraceae bacterium]
MTESTSLSPAGPTTTPAAPSEGEATEALAHLAKMSGTGSAFGAAEYVAISPMSIVTLMFGFASALSLLVSLFLFIPLVGILCGLLALRQIRNSNGTQGGLIFVFSGMILCLLFGGAVSARQAVAAARTRRDTQQCADVLAKFGDEIKAQRYDVIYNDMTSDVFRDMVPLKRFRESLATVRVHPFLGELQSVKWAGNPIDFEPVAGTDAKFAYAMMLLKFQKGQDPAREMIKLTDRDGSWKIEALPQLFPNPKTNPNGFPGG